MAKEVRHAIDCTMEHWCRHIGQIVLFGSKQMNDHKAYTCHKTQHFKENQQSK